MESNAWLVLVTAGLVFDICGVIILAGPLLKFNRKKLENAEASLKRQNKIMSKKEIIFLGKYPEVTKKHLEKLTDLILQGTMIEDVQKQREKEHVSKEARIALIIITTGFLLQIIGNAMK